MNTYTVTVFLVLAATTLGQIDFSGIQLDLPGVSGTTESPQSTTAVAAGGIDFSGIQLDPPIEPWTAKTMPESSTTPGFDFSGISLDPVDLSVKASTAPVTTAVVLEGLDFSGIQLDPLVDAEPTSSTTPGFDLSDISLEPVVSSATASAVVPVTTVVTEGVDLSDSHIGTTVVPETTSQGHVGLLVAVLAIGILLLCASIGQLWLATKLLSRTSIAFRDLERGGGIDP
ncbi:hypothetical protein FOL47_000144 [Perkinsus chesapeaki]|uniref:Uncharacterized protein n=1 Tax=Perkinsus chesapeaki TaxID=330153 RepID=A0A7J6N1C2_PERCH|nr:hypothetical protein FOL47_000144 [Perkinsus chesapeaki]